MTEEGATQLYERRAAELKRLDLMWTEAVSQGWSSDFAKPVREWFDSAGAY